MLNFLYQQNANRNTAAIALRPPHIITGVGKSINLPNVPDVLISNVAKASRNK
ncbi:hypothetical protein JCM19274_3427 [Algibacter lectus]|uniref:Uncharacterized protein n=1 Tax=Algibacter lectus TaxID=221126 RepID=A0A090WU04_9FLAO|nr:hypothetical protein [Algibacter lectus]GAL78869.1 hypothetical protein JCM19274_3427 [Algibacter lectus]